MAMPLKMRGDTFFVECKLGGANKLDLLGVIDSGSSVSFLSETACERAKLEYKGSENKFMRIHGKGHRKIDARRYRGVIVVGTKAGSGTVYSLDVRPTVNGMRVDAVLGRDILRHFRVTLDWRDGTGWLEE